MMNVLKYKGYIGSMETSVRDMCLHGKILFINDLITYEAETPNALKLAFEEAVDDYLETCAKLKKIPQISYKGTLNVRIGPSLHKEVAFHAEMEGVSINEYIKQALQYKLQQDHLH
jgi:predicted HicB family RNase H-like nuclease